MNAAIQNAPKISAIGFDSAAAQSLPKGDVRRGFIGKSPKNFSKSEAVNTMAGSIQRSIGASRSSAQPMGLQDVPQSIAAIMLGQASGPEDIELISQLMQSQHEGIMTLLNGWSESIIENAERDAKMDKDRRIKEQTGDGGSAGAQKRLFGRVLASMSPKYISADDVSKLREKVGLPDLEKGGASLRRASQNLSVNLSAFAVDNALTPPIGR